MHLRHVAVAVTTALIAVSLAGCSAPPPPEPTALAIVLGAHANQPQFGSAALASVLDTAVAENATIALVTDEGTPRLFAKATVGELPNNPATRAEEVRKIRGSLVAAIDGAVATSPETNPLEAIAQGAAALRGVAGSARIVVLSSMVQTTPTLDFTRGLLDADVQDILEVVRPGLPDLTNVTVELWAVGQTAPPQEPLSELGRRQLAAIWTAVLEAAGAAVVIPATQVGGSPSADLPPVTPVAITTGPVPVADCRAEVPDARVGFASESADFLQPEVARQVIAEVAEQLRGCPGVVRVLGTTSSVGTEDGRLRVSSARASAVAELLAEALSRDAAEFDVRGLGYDTGEGRCVVDRVDGQPVEALMGENRKVVVTVG